MFQTSKTKVKIKEAKGSNKFNAIRGKTQLSPEILAPAGSEISTRDIEMPKNAATIKKTYTMIMKKFVNPRLDLITSGMQTLENLKLLNYRKKIILNDRSPALPSNSKRDSTPESRDVLQVGWTGQKLDKQATVPFVETSVHHYNIENALADWPEIKAYDKKQVKSVKKKEFKKKNQNKSKNIKTQKTLNDTENRIQNTPEVNKQVISQITKEVQRKELYTVPAKTASLNQISSLAKSDERKLINKDNSIKESSFTNSGLTSDNVQLEPNNTQTEHLAEDHSANISGKRVDIKPLIGEFKNDGNNDNLLSDDQAKKITGKNNLHQNHLNSRDYHRVQVVNTEPVNESSNQEVHLNFSDNHNLSDLKTKLSDSEENKQESISQAFIISSPTSTPQEASLSTTYGLQEDQTKVVLITEQKQDKMTMKTEKGCRGNYNRNSQIAIKPMRTIPQNTPSRKASRPKYSINLNLNSKINFKDATTSKSLVGIKPDNLIPKCKVKTTKSLQTTNLSNNKTSSTTHYKNKKLKPVVKSDYVKYVRNKALHIVPHHSLLKEKQEEANAVKYTFKKNNLRKISDVESKIEGGKSMTQLKGSKTNKSVLPSEITRSQPNFTDDPKKIVVKGNNSLLNLNHRKGTNPALQVNSKYPTIKLSGKTDSKQIIADKISLSTPNKSDKQITQKSQTALGNKVIRYNKELFQINSKPKIKLKENTKTVVANTLSNINNIMQANKLLKENTHKNWESLDRKSTVQNLIQKNSSENSTPKVNSSDSRKTTLKKTNKRELDKFVLPKNSSVKEDTKKNTLVNKNKLDKKLINELKQTTLKSEKRKVHSKKSRPKVALKMYGAQQQFIRNSTSSISFIKSDKRISEKVIKQASTKSNIKLSSANYNRRSIVSNIDTPLPAKIQTRLFTIDHFLSIIPKQKLNTQSNNNSYNESDRILNEQITNAGTQNNKHLQIKNSRYSVHGTSGNKNLLLNTKGLNIDTKKPRSEEISFSNDLDPVVSEGLSVKIPGERDYNVRVLYSRSQKDNVLHYNKTHPRNIPTNNSKDLSIMDDDKLSLNKCKRFEENGISISKNCNENISSNPVRFRAKEGKVQKADYQNANTDSNSKKPGNLVTAVLKKITLTNNDNTVKKPKKWKSKYHRLQIKKLNYKKTNLKNKCNLTKKRTYIQTNKQHSENKNHYEDEKQVALVNFKNNIDRYKTEANLKKKEHNTLPDFSEPKQIYDSTNKVSTTLNTPQDKKTPKNPVTLSNKLNNIINMAINSINSTHVPSQKLVITTPRNESGVNMFENVIAPSNNTGTTLLSKNQVLPSVNRPNTELNLTHFQSYRNLKTQIQKPTTCTSTENNEVSGGDIEPKNDKVSNNKENYSTDNEEKGCHDCQTQKHCITHPNTYVHKIKSYDHTKDADKNVKISSTNISHDKIKYHCKNENVLIHSHLNKTFNNSQTTSYQNIFDLPFLNKEIQDDCIHKMYVNPSNSSKITEIPNNNGDCKYQNKIPMSNELYSYKTNQNSKQSSLNLSATTNPFISTNFNINKTKVPLTSLEEKCDTGINTENNVLTNKNLKPFDLNSSKEFYNADNDTIPNQYSSNNRESKARELLRDQENENNDIIMDKVLKSLQIINPQKQLGVNPTKKLNFNNITKSSTNSDPNCKKQTNTIILSKYQESCKNDGKSNNGEQYTKTQNKNSNLTLSLKLSNDINPKSVHDLQAHIRATDNKQDQTKSFFLNKEKYKSDSVIEKLLKHQQNHTHLNRLNIASTSENTSGQTNNNKHSWTLSLLKEKYESIISDRKVRNVQNNSRSTNLSLNENKINTDGNIMILSKNLESCKNDGKSNNGEQYSKNQNKNSNLTLSLKLSNHINPKSVHDLQTHIRATDNKQDQTKSFFLNKEKYKSDSVIDKLLNHEQNHTNFNRLNIARTSEISSGQINNNKHCWALSLLKEKDDSIISDRKFRNVQNNSRSTNLSLNEKKLNTGLSFKSNKIPINKVTTGSAANLKKEGTSLNVSKHISDKTHNLNPIVKDPKLSTQVPTKTSDNRQNLTASLSRKQEMVKGGSTNNFANGKSFQITKNTSKHTLDKPKVKTNEEITNTNNQNITKTLLQINNSKHNFKNTTNKEILNSQALNIPSTILNQTEHLKNNYKLSKSLQNYENNNSVALSKLNSIKNINGKQGFVTSKNSVLVLKKVPELHLVKKIDTISQNMGLKEKYSSKEIAQSDRKTGKDRDGHVINTTEKLNLLKSNTMLHEECSNKISKNKSKTDKKDQILKTSNLGIASQCFKVDTKVSSFTARNEQNLNEKVKNDEENGWKQKIGLPSKLIVKNNQPEKANHHVITNSIVTNYRHSGATKWLNGHPSNLNKTSKILTETSNDSNNIEKDQIKLNQSEQVRLGTLHEVKFLDIESINPKKKHNNINQTLNNERQVGINRIMSTGNVPGIQQQVKKIQSEILRPPNTKRYLNIPKHPIENKKYTLEMVDFDGNIIRRIDSHVYIDELPSDRDKTAETTNQKAITATEEVYNNFDLPPNNLCGFT